MRNRDGDEDANNLEDRKGYDKSEVYLALLGWEDLLLLLLPAGSGLIPAILGIIN
jgi:hypothetical protein